MKYVFAQVLETVLWSHPGQCTFTIKTYCSYEERSAAFFALGRARESNKPVAVICTSGTAAGELLPAAMEGYYTGTPLLLVTADRPRRFHGTGAPQTAEKRDYLAFILCFHKIEYDVVCR